MKKERLLSKQEFYEKWFPKNYLKIDNVEWSNPKIRRKFKGDINSVIKYYGGKLSYRKEKEEYEKSLREEVETVGLGNLGKW